MKIKPLSELCKEDYDLKFLSFIEMPQAEENAPFSCISQPKKQDLLLYVNDCFTQYVTKDKKTLATHPGDVVYIPTGSEYTVSCLCAEENASTYQINLHLSDCGEPVKLSDGIMIFSPKNEKIRRQFERLLALSADPSTFPTELKALTYEILALLEKEFTARKVPPIIRAAVDHIHLHFKEKPQVSALAQLCYISPEYFRKIFQTTARRIYQPPAPAKSHRISDVQRPARRTDRRGAKLRHPRPLHLAVQRSVSPHPACLSETECVSVAHVKSDDIQKGRANRFRKAIGSAFY